MKKILTLVVAALCCATMFATEGALNGRFTINADGDQIFFSQGNLQYQPSTQIWLFAENQWDYVGTSQSNDLFDLFGWATGSTPTSGPKYPYVDWGTNAISNGGNEANLWRTLTIYEWIYLFRERTNAATLFALGSVNEVNGVILLPDNWVLPEGASFVASTTQGLEPFSYYYYNNGGNNFYDNTYTTAQWAVMETAGAVFLPAAGLRDGSQLLAMNAEGFYWSSSDDNAEYPSNLWFRSYQLNPEDDHPADNGLSVRLVKDVDTTPIENVDVTTKVSKTLRDGVLLIEKNGKTYNATGAEIK